ncbi:MAG: hypothetical protein M1836_007419 [Candelina mexicana]|nr:MAG: hypothetical protein M1836_007419 [Candelina mexicana]
MDDVSSLSRARTILLAVALAVDSNIPGLRCLTAVHPLDLPLQLLLRILLTFLPESTEPNLYTSFIEEVFLGTLSPQTDITIDLAPIEDLSEGDARKRIRKLHLLQLEYPKISSGVSEGLVTQFLIHRAHRIEVETGLLPLLPQLLVPFLDHSDYLRTWLISTILPMLRLEYEYYPSGQRTLTLEVLERLDLRLGINTLLSKIDCEDHTRDSGVNTVARDMRGLIGPWIYGHTRQQRRRLDDEHLQTALSNQNKKLDTEDAAEHGIERKGFAWSFVWMWFMQQAVSNFEIVVRAIEQWDGPHDVDVGGYDTGHQVLDEDANYRLQRQYAQMALSTIYRTEEDSIQTLEGAHRMLIRVACLMDLQAPANLSIGLASTSSIEQPQVKTENISISSFLDTALLQPHNPITTPNSETLSFLSSIVLSAYTVQSLGHKISSRKATELFLLGNGEVQARELQKVLHSISTTPKRDSKDWKHIRESLIWLRSGKVEIPAEEAASYEQANGNGIFGKVAQDFLEREILKAFLAGTPTGIICVGIGQIVDLTNHHLLEYQLAVETYVEPPAPKRPLPLEQVEKVVVESAMISYDNASNGNKARGGVKKASDILRHCDALLAATHALSFYSLTLKRGTPFRPVNIRANADPVSLLGKVLDQNPRSYTKLDDLLGIGRNLVAAGQMVESKGGAVTQPSQEEVKSELRIAERRITAMAIEAALAENDFETAYSYVINRLSPPPNSPSTSGPPEREGRALQDDISWRAAYQAGCYRIKPTSKASSTAHTDLRRLEQRMELLSQALLLAPSAALSEILGVWRRCEEDLGGLLKQETEAEDRWDDKGDRKIPGRFVLETSEPMNEQRRGVARGTNEEAPMGLFDVARGAAAALSKSAFPLRGAARAVGKGQGFAAVSPGIAGGHQRVYSTTDSDSDDLAAGDGGGRVRKRDMVTNMVSGGLASGIGWVLGAPPASQGQAK